MCTGTVTYNLRYNNIIDQTQIGNNIGHTSLVLFVKTCFSQHIINIRVLYAHMGNVNLTFKQIEIKNVFFFSSSVHGNNL